MWNFWHGRQHSRRVRLIDVDAISGNGNIIGPPDEVAHNAIRVAWRPAHGPAQLSLAVRCLSTDFSAQKGVKGIPLLIQIDTTTENGQNLIHRAILQVKTFCDKGADRKLREEERRMRREQNANNVYHSPRSVFETLFADPEESPFLFVPNDNEVQGQRSRSTNKSRVMLYSRQENETVYTPLHIVPPSVQGLVRAVSTKYEIDSVDIRFVFRRTKKGVVVRMDDDMIRFYCDGDTFLMKVLANDNNDSKMFYDLVFADDDEYQEEEIAAKKIKTENVDD